ncbi:MAG: mechanosensitive ion channel [Candidatus Dormibacteraeota bacterium]|nr:mechanosensitive ion channel [Candidatus Dormibacteraeota bacterium]
MSLKPRMPERGSLTWRIARSASATLVLLAAFVVAPELTVLVPALKEHSEFVLAITWGIAAIALVAGVIAIRGWLGLIFQQLDRQAAVVLRNIGSWALYACLVLALLTMLGVDLSGLLVGGAIAGVIIGAAAQSSLGNFFAGILLMVARPFEVGVTLRIRTTIAGMLEFEGTVADTNAFFTTLRTTKGELLRLPNQVVMNSAMTVGKPPLQATLQITVPAVLSLTTLRTGIRDRLQDRGAEVVVTPISFTPAGAAAATVLCQVDVRSRRSLTEGALTDAVAATMAQQQQQEAAPAEAKPAG